MEGERGSLPNATAEFVPWGRLGDLSMGVRGDVWAARGPRDLERAEGGGRRGNAAHFPPELLLLTSLGLTLSRLEGTVELC